MMQGVKTEFFTDVKLPVKAGMDTVNGKVINAKIREVGYEVFRLYYDTKDKDWQVGSERIKRVIYSR